jgi:hypothetical protein
MAKLNSNSLFRDAKNASTGAACRPFLAAEAREMAIHDPWRGECKRSRSLPDAWLAGPERRLTPCHLHDFMVAGISAGCFLDHQLTLTPLVFFNSSRRCKRTPP